MTIFEDVGYDKYFNDVYLYVPNEDLIIHLEANDSNIYQDYIIVYSMDSLLRNEPVYECRRHYEEGADPSDIENITHDSYYFADDKEVTEEEFYELNRYLVAVPLTGYESARATEELLRTGMIPMEQHRSL